MGELTEADLARLEALGVGGLVTGEEFARLVAEVRRLQAALATTPEGYEWKSPTEEQLEVRRLRRDSDLRAVDTSPKRAMGTAEELTNIGPRVAALEAEVAELRQALDRLGILPPKPTNVGELIYQYHCDQCGRPTYGNVGVRGTRCSKCPGTFR